MMWAVCICVAALSACIYKTWVRPRGCARAKAGRGCAQQGRFGGDKCPGKATEEKLCTTTPAGWRCSHTQAKTSCCLNVSRLSAGTGGKANCHLKEEAAFCG